MYWLLWSVLQQYPLKLTPFSKCKCMPFRPFLHWYELTIQWPRKFHRCVVCHRQGVNLHLLNGVNFNGYCWYTLHRSPCTPINVQPKFAHFENPFLKRIDYNWKIIRRWKIKLMPVKSYTLLLSTFKVWKLPDHYVKSY